MHLPVAIARETHVHADQRVKLTVFNDQIIITPAQDEPLTLEQRQAQFDPFRHGGEAIQLRSN